VPDAQTETQPQPTAQRNGELLTLPAFDVRRKRPPLLSFVLRWETLRRAVRVATLLVLDFAGLFSAIYAALSSPGTPRASRRARRSPSPTS
jgi:hypothetical protein